MTDTPTDATAWRVIVRRLRADRRSMVAIGALLTMSVLVLLGPLLVAHREYEQLDITNLVHVRPGAEFLLGTDAYSRDVLSRVLSGGRVSLQVAMSAVFIETFVGVAWGLAAGLAGGWVDTIMMRGVDAGLSVPRVLLLLTILAATPMVPVWALVVILGLTGWFGMARLVRNEVRSVRNADFVMAARSLGASPLRLALRHVLPHVSGQVLVSATLAVGHVIVLEAGLSFLGIGVQPPRASWGNIIGDGSEFIATAPWVSIAPGLCLVITVLAVSALGDGLRDAIAPRQLPRT